MNSRQTWRGQGLYFDAHATGTEIVSVEILPDGMAIHGERTNMFFPFAQCKMTVAGGGYVRIEVRHSGGSVLSIQSPEAVEALAANHQVKHGLFGLLSHNKQVLAVSISCVAAAILFFSVGLDFLANVSAKLIPFALEKKLGDTVVQGMIAGSRVADDSATVRVLAKCAGVVQAFDVSGSSVQYDIILIEDKETRNAFALPGGHIVLYRGILDIMQNESELFALLGHEVGHVVERHGVKRIARGAILGLMTSLLLGDANGVAAILINNSQQLVSLSYDRDEESEADMFGLNAIQRARIDPNGIVSLFEKLKREEGSSGSLTFLSTHPDIDDRVKTIKSELRKVHTAAVRTRLSAGEWKRLTESANKDE